MGFKRKAYNYDFNEHFRLSCLNDILLISVYKIEMRETEKSIKTCVTFVRHMNSEHMKIEKRKKRRNVSTARLKRDHQF